MTRVFAYLAPALLVACIPTSSDDEADDTRGGFHDVTISWRILNLDGTVMSACPPGFTTLFTNLYKTGHVPPPDALIKTPCTPEGSLTERVATSGELAEVDGPGRYDYEPRKDIWIGISEETGSVFAAMTPEYHVENLTSDVTIAFDLYPAGGVAVLPWTLSSGLTTAPLASCASAGVDQIEVAMRDYYDDTAPLVVAGTWGCTDVDPYHYYDPNANSRLLDEAYELGSGQTIAFAPGTYFVELRAKRAGAIVGTADADVSIEDQNTATRIAPADIPIDDR